MKKPTSALVANKAAPKKPAAKGKTKKSEKLCAHSRCRAQASSDGYCRLHYLANWRHIKLNEKIKAEKRLNAFVDRIAKKYPKDYLEKIKEGLENEDKFKETVAELDVETGTESKDTDKEFLENFMRIVKPGE